MVLKGKNTDHAMQATLEVFEKADKLHEVMSNLPHENQGGLRATVGKFQAVVASGRDGLFEGGMLRDRTSERVLPNAVSALPMYYQLADELGKAVIRTRDLIDAARIVAALGEDGSRRAA
ncbi:hypothetical protein [Amaricoccus macauensis]|uniref:hypothetical protein n=1 Tax=Amaricoccus macauensis TaxID=57001 RepID=UPI003C79C295